jgi:serine/threonine protein kinase
MPLLVTIMKNETQWQQQNGMVDSSRGTADGIEMMATTFWVVLVLVVSIYRRKVIFLLQCMNRCFSTRTRGYLVRRPCRNRKQEWWKTKTRFSNFMRTCKGNDTHRTLSPTASTAFCLWRTFCGVFTLLLLPSLAVEHSNVPTVVASSYAKPTTAIKDPIDRSLHPPHDVSNRPFLAICTVDGNVLVLHAQSGEQLCAFSSGPPLIGPSEPLEDNRRIVPGPDGRLYRSSDDGLLTPLTITVTDVLNNPIKICKGSPPSSSRTDDDDEEPSSPVVMDTECGIVTATKTTTLFALDAFTGKLVWRQHANGTTTKTDIQTAHTVLLQREDMLVQQVGTKTGETVWNVSLGTMQALEFEQTPITGDLPLSAQRLLPSGSFKSSRGGKNILLEQYLEELPHIVFSEDGTTVSAVDPTKMFGKRLWSREFPMVVSTVFGLNGKTWEPLTVLDEGYADDIDVGINNRRLLPESNTALELYRSPHLNYYLKTLNAESLYNDMGRLLYHTYQHGTSSRAKGPKNVGKGQTSDDSLLSSTSSSFHYTDGISPQLLELPSPEPFKSIRHRSDTLLYDGRGIYFSWQILVACIICTATTAIAVGRYFYNKKKLLWVKRATVSFDLNSLAKHRSTSEGSVDDHQVTSFSKLQNPKHLLRSYSLPGKMEDMMERRGSMSSPALAGTNASISPPVLALCNENQKLAITSSTNPAPFKPLLNRSSTEVSASQGVGLIDGSIPLIQYSRYSSEFEELGALGKGGFGSVFQCRNALDGRSYAIKKVRIRRSAKLSPAEFSRRLQRTLREVKSLALLDHPNIVRYYTAWLELDHDEDGHRSETFRGSEYDLMSPSSTGRRMAEHGPYDDSIDSSSSSQDHERSYRNGKVSRRNDRSMDGSVSHSHTFEYQIPGIPDALDDYGFVFDRSGEERCEEEKKDVGTTTDGSICSAKRTRSHLQQQNGSSSFHSRSQRGISFQSLDPNAEQSSTGLSKESRNQSEAGRCERSQDDDAGESLDASVSVKYILYIQMQFCSQKTLADFLSNEAARKGPSNVATDVDIPHALKLFLQVMKGVKHVHNQGLIHRDLKPNNW